MLHPTKAEGDGRDAAILEQAGLLRPGKCVLAHGVHVSPEERRLLQTTRAAIAHCPLSNVFFAQGVLPVKSMMADGNLLILALTLTLTITRALTIVPTLRVTPTLTRTIPVGVTIGLGTDISGGYDPSMLSGETVVL